MFTDRNFAFGATFIALIGLGMFSSMVLLALYSQKLLGYDALTSGLVLAPGGLGNMFSLHPVRAPGDPRGPAAAPHLRLPGQRASAST